MSTRNTEWIMSIQLNSMHNVYRVEQSELCLQSRTK
jgi:hypothetical protein